MWWLDLADIPVFFSNLTLFGSNPYVQQHTSAAVNKIEPGFGFSCSVVILWYLILWKIILDFLQQRFFLIASCYSRMTKMLYCSEKPPIDEHNLCWFGNLFSNFLFLI